MREKKTVKSPASASLLGQAAWVCGAESRRLLAGVLSALLQWQLLVQGKPPCSARQHTWSTVLVVAGLLAGDKNIGS